MIDCFKDEYRFLSNFYPCKIEGKFMTYPSTEHYFQANKAKNLIDHVKIARAETPGEAKRFGKEVELRPDWETVKLGVMEEALRLKFADPELAQMLKNTGEEELVEGNWWGDTYWGKCKGVGENHLGKLLMKIRSEL